MAERFQPRSNEELKQAVRNYYEENDRSHGLIGTWDTSLITDMSVLFRNMIDFNESIADWNTSSVKRMNCMFAGCALFNQPLDKWDTSSVINMNGMFYFCTSFNQPLHMWDTSSVTTMGGMFWRCTSFHQPMGNWHAQRMLFQHCPDPDYCCTAVAVHDHYCVK